jgi:hypothetical protein
MAADAGCVGHEFATLSSCSAQDSDGLDEATTDLSFVSDFRMLSTQQVCCASSHHCVPILRPDRGSQPSEPLTSRSPWPV